MHLKIKCRERRPSFQCAKLPRSTPSQIEQSLLVIVEVTADGDSRMSIPSIFHLPCREMPRPACPYIDIRRSSDCGGVVNASAERGALVILLPRAFGTVVAVRNHEFWNPFLERVFD